MSALCAAGAKAGILGLLAVQNAGQTVIIKYAQRHGSTPDSMVLMLVVEAVKAVASLILFALLEVPGSGGNWLQHFMPSALRRNVKLAPPALMFAFQNQLLFVAVHNLEPPVFQALAQLKIVFAGVFSAVLLKKRLSQVQWAALLLLACGAALVQVEGTMCKAADHGDGAATEGHDSFKGLLAVVFMSATSGLAGCYTERMLKTEKMPPMWLQSALVALFSILVLSGMTAWARADALLRAGGAAVVPLKHGAIGAARRMASQELQQSPLVADGLLRGFNNVTWVVVAVLSLGGMIVVTALRYADNVLKGMAVVASLLLSGMWSSVAFGTTLGPVFYLASAVICLSMFLYQAAPLPSNAHAGKVPQPSPREVKESGAKE